MWCTVYLGDITDVDFHSGEPAFMACHFPIFTTLTISSNHGRRLLVQIYSLCCPCWWVLACASVTEQVAAVLSNAVQEVYYFSNLHHTYCETRPENKSTMMNPSSQARHM